MHRVYNCGSVLQAYALQSYVEHIGFHVEIIDYIYPNESHYNGAANNRWECKCNFLLICKHLIHFRWNAIIRQFDKDFFAYISRCLLKLSSHKYESASAIISNPPQYDIILIGSDQVWNERFIKLDNTFMAPFAKGSSSFVSYASSMPNPDINNEYKKRIATYLSRFDKISTREECAAKMLQTVVGKNVKCVLDPVFLLSAFDWQNLFKFKQSSGGYILYVALGYMDGRINLEHDLKKIKEISHLKVVSTLKGKFVDEYCREFNPRSFVKTIACADYVVTDSFHVSAFSMIFGVPLLYKSQIESDTRIVNLMEKVASFDGLCYRVDIVKLAREIDSSRQYLLDALMYNAK